MSVSRLLVITIISLMMRASFWTTAYTQVRQFEEWNLEVYGKIQSRLTEQLEQTPSNDITKRRNAEYQKFLDTTNSKVRCR